MALLHQPKVADYDTNVSRASNVLNAGKYSRIPRSPTSTPKRVGTISSKSPPMKCVFFFLTTRYTDETLKIKPLTEEEKRQKLAELREKMAEKRFKKAEEEAKEARANELIRRKAGKVRAGSPPCSKRPPLTAQETPRTGSYASQRGSEKQANVEGPRGQAPRFVPLPSLSPLTPHLITQMVCAFMIFQKRRKTRRLSPRSKRKSKPTSGNARKRPRGKRRCARVELLQSNPPHLLPRLQPRRLQLPDVTSQRRACKFGSRAVGSP
jgi:hypothetical protein